MGLSNNTVGLEDISNQFDHRDNRVVSRFNDLGHVISGYLPVKNSTVIFLCLGC